MHANDSLSAKRNLFHLFTRHTLSGTFSTQKNWYEQNSKSIAFLFSHDGNLRITSQKFKQTYQFRAMLGYMRLLSEEENKPVKAESIQQTWIKNNDYWRIQALWTENAVKNLTHTWTFNATSQFLNTKKVKYDYLTDRDTLVRTASFFNPGTITVGYGLNWNFWEYSYINASFATIKFSTRPRYNGYVDPKDKELAKTKNAYLYFDYGMNINALVSKKLNENVLWEHNLYYFMNGISRTQVKLDMQNRLLFTFLKHLQFSVNTHIIYDPMFSYKLQYQHDFMLGLMYEVKKRKTNRQIQGSN